MPLQRGSYGIEYDDRPGFSYQKLYWAFLLIPVVALMVLLFRGCQRDAVRPPLAEESTQQSRQQASELKAARVRPSIFKHFAQTWLNSHTSDKSKAQSVEAKPKEKWLVSVPAALVPTLEKQPSEVKRLLQQVAECEAADDLVGARLIYRQLLIRKDAEEIRGFLERKIGDLNTTLLFSDRPMPEKTKHLIEAGDLITKLTKKYGDTQEFLLQANGIEKPELLRIGRGLWVLDNPVFELTVFKKGGSAVLTLDGRFFKRYVIGVGPAEASPKGTYRVSGRIKNADYSVSGQDDTEEEKAKKSQGTCWLTLAATDETPEVKRFGLHGTWNESSLGRPSDAGYIRFRNADIEELYVLLPLGSLVNIAD